jgi:hypothetical protein
MNLILSRIGAAIELSAENVREIADFLHFQLDLARSRLQDLRPKFSAISDEALREMKAGLERGEEFGPRERVEQGALALASLAIALARGGHQSRAVRPGGMSHGGKEHSPGPGDTQAAGFPASSAPLDGHLVDFPPMSDAETILREPSPCNRCSQGRRCAAVVPAWRSWRMCSGRAGEAGPIRGCDRCRRCGHQGRCAPRLYDSGSVNHTAHMRTPPHCGNWAVASPLILMFPELHSEAAEALNA